MKLELSQSFYFNAAHTLTRLVPLEESSASRRIHGHTYHAEVAIEGTPSSEGFLDVGKRTKKSNGTVDLFYFKKRIEEVRQKLDHQNLDEVSGLGAATIENLCIYIAEQMGDEYPVSSVTVWRNEGDKCRFKTGAS